MRELSQEKGRRYQRMVKYWITGNSLLGLTPEVFGDAYDITNKAAKIGDEYFDFSLKLSIDKEVKSILYAECKYRSEYSGNINSEFEEFIKKIYSIIFSKKESTENAEFFFISNIPPDKWRNLINKKHEFIVSEFKYTDQATLIQMLDRLHVLILSEKIIGG